MHDPYFFTSDPIGPIGAGTRVVLRGADARHLAAVRRARANDRVRVCDGAGAVVEARVVSVGPREVELEGVYGHVVPRPFPRVRLFQALAKAAKVDFVVGKLVEIGVDEVVVFSSGRSVPRWDAAKREHAAGRWQDIAREAAKQSRRAWLPTVAGPVGADEAASILSGLSGEELALLADESSSATLREVVAAELPAGLAVIVGPEGGLTGSERAAFVSAGAVPFSLGPQILRTETAALAAAALVLHHAGRLG